MVSMERHSRGIRVSNPPARGQPLGNRPGLTDSLPSFGQPYPPQPPDLHTLCPRTHVRAVASLPTSVALEIDEQ